MMTKGILLMAWGKRGYAFMAYNLAASIKHHSPDVKIHLVASRGCFKSVSDHSYFDSIEWLDSDPLEPGKFKAAIYDHLPFDCTLFLDVDAICLRPIEPLLDRLVNSDWHYATYINEMYDINSPNILPQMYWAYRADIWQHYGFDETTKFPATQSSIQFIRRCDKTKELYELFNEAFNNPIPLERLRNKWGGGQPDELYLNVALAQQGEVNHIGTESLWFGNNHTKRPFQIAETHYFISYFGWKLNVKQQFWDYYDKQMQRILSVDGKPHHFKSHLIKSDKIANVQATTTRTVVRPVSMVKPDSVKIAKKPGKVALFTSYFEPKEMERVREIRRTMELNIQCSSIDVIYNLGTPYINDKVVNIPYDRPTYKDFINELNKVEADYYIIANSDIYFTSEIEAIKDLQLSKRALCLSRWDVTGNGMAKLFNYEWSQDVWIFKGKPPRIDNIDFHLGLPGCDNRFAYELAMAGLEPINPAKSIKTYHLHTSNKRSYTERDRLKGEMKAVAVTDSTSYKIKTCLIIQPGKVGDIICVLPIAKHYHDLGFVVYWQCPEQFHAMLSYANYVIPVTENDGTHDKVIDLSFGLNNKAKHHRDWQLRKRGSNSFVHFKYEIASTPLSLARDIEYTRNYEREEALYNLLRCDELGSYCLVHNNSTYGSPIDVLSDKAVIEFKPMGSFTIFDWRKVIENASEIHCIDSSLANFVDAIGSEADLHYYITNKVPLKADRTLLTKNWNVYEISRATLA